MESTSATTRFYCNYQSDWYIKIGDTYYNRLVGKAWQQIDASKLPSDILVSHTRTHVEGARTGIA